MFNACLADTIHPFLASCLQDPRGAVIQKLDPISGAIVGRRCLGLGEKDRCAMLSCVGFDMKEPMDTYLTTPPPEDLSRRQLAIDLAEDAFIQAEFVLADAVRSGLPADVDTASATRDAARLALADAEQPLKFVTNFCYAGDGTVKMFHLIQNWHHCVPSNITCSDDECNMYGECDREDCLGWLREFCPMLLPCVRFFYGSLPRIWMGGATVPILKTPIWIFADGARIPRAPNETAPAGAKPSYTSRLADEHSVRLPHEIDGHMRSCTGGMMGCPLSTMLCVGAHHRMLCEVQRRHPTVNITGTADDTYFNGDERVHAAYECKRTHAWETMRLTSKLTKVSVYSPIGNQDGNLNGTPAYLPGSPHHPGGVLKGGKAAGGYYGDDDWCSTKLRQTLEHKIANLDLVDHIRDFGKARNATQLRSHLMRVIASAIPAHWMRMMMPHVTAAAAAAVDARIEESFASLADLAHSPPERRALSRSVASLRIREGGLELAAFSATRTALFLAAYVKSRPAIARIFPPSAACSDSHHLANAAVSACAALSSTLDSVRARHAELDSREYHCVDGSVESDYHPYLPDALELPSPESLRTTPTTSTTPKLREKQLVAVVHNDLWLNTLDTVNAFDTANTTSTVKRREAKRFISASQTGAGEFLRVVSDDAIRGSTITSSTLLTAVQYRCGAFLTALAPVLDEMTRRGVDVGQSDRLGDTAINEANATTRHNAVNRCIYNARAAVATATVRLGDKGSTTQSRMEASRRFEMYNKGHVPDIIEIDAVDTLYEVKCWTPIRKFQALGHGSTKKGGAVSTNEGSHIAFGGTAESARHLTLGCKQRGTADQAPFDHATGVGYVAGHAGHYADALARGRQVVLIVVETTGAVHPDAIGMLYGWHAEARVEGCLDRTVYGASRTATTSFFTHHLRLISLAAVIGAALPVAIWAKSRKSHLLSGAPLAGLLPVVM